MTAPGSVLGVASWTDHHGIPETRYLRACVVCLTGTFETYDLDHDAWVESDDGDRETWSNCTHYRVPLCLEHAREYDEHRDCGAAAWMADQHEPQPGTVVDPMDRAVCTSCGSPGCDCRAEVERDAAQRRRDESSANFGRTG